MNVNFFVEKVVNCVKMCVFVIEYLLVTVFSESPNGYSSKLKILRKTLI